MLPESTFPVTGGIMQTEEVVPRAQSTGIDGSLTDSTTFQNQIHRSPLLQCSLPSPVLMAVKQEPQEDDERARDTNTLSQQAEADAAPVPVEAGHLGHHHHGHETGHQHHQVQGTEAITGPASHENTGRARSSRGRRKSRWKLKFHHQALPPEYLDHYEASLAQEALNASPTHQGRDSSAASPAPTASTSTSASTPSPVADVQGWLQRIAAMQQELYPRVVSSNPTIDASSLPSAYRRSVITSTGQSYPAHQSQHQQQHNSHAGNNASQHTQQQPAPRPPMKYSDLPYMGEITLDNSKPRRGRKPKKADICHLIYKNYGTILPGTPGHEERKQQSPRERLEIAREQVHHRVPFQRTDIQNRISSLLEKRLTQESRRSLAIVDGAREQDEPLNLCIRDLNQLKIRLHRKHGNVYESGQIKSETSSEADEIECLGTNFNVVEAPRMGDLVVANNNDTAVTNSNTINYNNTSSIDNHNNNNVSLNNNINNNNNNNNNTPNNNNNDPSTNPNNPGFVYWPNAGVFIHPMALQSQFLYYQKMAENERVSAKLDNQPKEQKIVPKSLYTMLETKSPTGVQPVPAVQQQTPIQQPASPRPKRNAPIGHQGQQPTKRKRSAIFIPPMPTENNNNPATEVSICKFKFTGGAKPSLQEKKSLSVDAGGNFRYYSGTGDKNMRGYEFFPRETLQQPAGQAGSSAGAFLSAAGERIPPPVPSQRLPVIPDPEGRRKRKTRKSLQREKLEQTFKEKGFLIQTQQLESAEGATYCKFRQLRKFTRYLFRSWKDYLPGNVRDLSGNGEGEIVDGEIDPDHGIMGASSPVTIPGMDVTNGSLEEHRTLPLT